MSGWLGCCDCLQRRAMGPTTRHGSSRPADPPTHQQGHNNPAFLSDEEVATPPPSPASRNEQQQQPDEATSGQEHVPSSSPPPERYRVLPQPIRPQLREICDLRDDRPGSGRRSAFMKILGGRPTHSPKRPRSPASRSPEARGSLTPPRRTGTEDRQVLATRSAPFEPLSWDPDAEWTADELVMMPQRRVSQLDNIPETTETADETGTTEETRMTEQTKETEKPETTENVGAGPAESGSGQPIDEIEPAPLPHTVRWEDTAGPPADPESGAEQTERSDATGRARAASMPALRKLGLSRLRRRSSQGRQSESSGGDPTRGRRWLRRLSLSRFNEALKADPPQEQQPPVRLRRSLPAEHWGLIRSRFDLDMPLSEHWKFLEAIVSRFEKIDADKYMEHIHEEVSSSSSEEDVPNAVEAQLLVKLANATGGKIPTKQAPMPAFCRKREREKRRLKRQSLSSDEEKGFSAEADGLSQKPALTDDQEHSEMSEGSAVRAESESVESVPVESEKSVAAQPVKPDSEKPATVGNVESDSEEQPNTVETAKPDYEEPGTVETAKSDFEEPVTVEIVKPDSEEPGTVETAKPDSEEPDTIETAKPDSEEPRLEPLAPAAEQSDAGQPSPARRASSCPPQQAAASIAPSAGRRRGSIFDWLLPASTAPPRRQSLPPPTTRAPQRTTRAHPTTRGPPPTTRAPQRTPRAPPSTTRAPPGTTRAPPSASLTAPSSVRRPSWFQEDAEPGEATIDTEYDQGAVRRRRATVAEVSLDKFLQDVNERTQHLIEEELNGEDPHEMLEQENTAHDEKVVPLLNPANCVTLMVAKGQLELEYSEDPSAAPSLIPSPCPTPRLGEGPGQDGGSKETDSVGNSSEDRQTLERTGVDARDGQRGDSNSGIKSKDKQLADNSGASAEDRQTTDSAEAEPPERHTADSTGCREGKPTADDAGGSAEEGKTLDCTSAGPSREHAVDLSDDNPAHSQPTSSGCYPEELLDERRHSSERSAVSKSQGRAQQASSTEHVKQERRPSYIASIQHEVAAMAESLKTKFQATLLHSAHGSEQNQSTGKSKSHRKSVSTRGTGHTPTEAMESVPSTTRTPRNSIASPTKQCSPAVSSAQCPRCPASPPPAGYQQPALTMARQSGGNEELATTLTQHHETSGADTGVEAEAATDRNLAHCQDEQTSPRLASSSELQSSLTTSECPSAQTSPGVSTPAEEPDLTVYPSDPTAPFQSPPDASESPAGNNPVWTVPASDEPSSAPPVPPSQLLDYGQPSWVTRQQRVEEEAEQRRRLDSGQRAAGRRRDSLLRSRADRAAELAGQRGQRSGGDHDRADLPTRPTWR